MQLTVGYSDERAKRGFRSLRVETSRGLEELRERSERAGRASSEAWSRAGEKARREMVGIENVGRAAMVGVSAAVAIAARSVLNYAGSNSYAAGQIRAVRSEVDRLYTSIGRDLSAGGAGFLPQLIRQVDDARRAAVDLIASPFVDTGAVDSAMRTMEEQDRQAKAFEFINRRRMERRARVTRDLPVANARAEADLWVRREFETIARAQNDGLLSQSQAEAERREVVKEADLRVQYETVKLQEQARKEREREAAAEREQSTARRRALDEELQRASIAAARAAGLEDEARAAEASLRMQERLRELERSGFQGEERQRRLETIQDLFRAESSAPAAAPEPSGAFQVRSLGPGSGNLAAQVFGRGRTGNPERSIEKNTGQTVALLEQIRRILDQNGFPTILG